MRARGWRASVVIVIASRADAPCDAHALVRAHQSDPAAFRGPWASAFHSPRVRPYFYGTDQGARRPRAYALASTRQR